MQGFWRTVSFAISRSDIILEIVDARMPDLTRNRSVENSIQRRRKTFILVLNKADLVTKRMRDDFLKGYKSKAVFVSCRKRAGIEELKNMIIAIASRRRWTRKVRVGVVGYPNTGKSSIINALTGRSAARVSPVAGMTRGVQWISGGGDIMFLDTPGVMPLNDRNEAEQALMDAIDPDKLENPDLAAMRIIQLFLDRNRASLERFYGVKAETEDATDILLEIGRRKNFLSRGGRVDETRTSLSIIRDWQRGRLLLDLVAG